MGKKKEKTDATGDVVTGEAVASRKKKESKQASLDVTVEKSVSSSPAPIPDGAVPFIAPTSVSKQIKTSKPGKATNKATAPINPLEASQPATPDQEATSPAEITTAKHDPALSREPGPAGDASALDGDQATASEGEAALMRAIESGEVGDAKFWQKNDYFRSLLDPDVINKIDFAKYDLAKLLQEFFTEMFKEEYIDFKVSGIAVHAAAKIYRHKITQVLEQQEKEEEELKKEALRRNIPSTISQPLRAGRSIATQEDFMNSMRSAIIEVMRKREKQAQRVAKQAAASTVATEEMKKVRMKKMLPESIRKALLGKERIEETFQRWLDIIYDGIKKSPDQQVSYFHDLKPLVEKKDRYGFRFEQARLFLSLMFLRNRDKIDVLQQDELADLFVKKP
ncbi:MAG: hypothetical protein GYA24_02865 [Candidatus Lokiarchaeota archaeon]|nr:hypothetical protein [Candidatus Lokiarchaeota archaeon]